VWENKPFDETHTNQVTKKVLYPTLYIKYKDFLYDFKSYSQLFLKKVTFSIDVQILIKKRALELPSVCDNSKAMENKIS
jgi:hypothetical protein